MPTAKPKASKGVTNQGVSPLATIATKAAKDAPLHERLYPTAAPPVAAPNAAAEAGATT